MKRPVLLRSLVAGGVLIAVSGCSFTGVNSYPLPFSKGGGDDAVHATVLLENATNLVPNSEVKYGEVTVGSVRNIELDGWTAKLTIGLEKDADVPANVTAKVAQKSLLGAEYLELKSPGGDDVTASGPRLAEGATIGLERTERYPETEEVLTAASLLLNGGGLPQIQSISSEVNAALSGRNGKTKDLVREIDTTARSLDEQRQTIFKAMDQIRDLSSTLNDDHIVITKALESLPKGVDSLEANRVALTKMLAAMGRVRDASRTALVENGEDLGEILDNLRPVTAALADQGSDLPKVVQLLTYPFPANDVPGYTRSDYLNLFATFSVSTDRLSRAFTGLTPLDGVLSGLMGPPSGPAIESGDPLMSPLEGLTDPLDGLAGSLDDLLGTSGGEQSQSGGKPDPSPSSTPTAPAPGLLERLLGGQ